MLTDEELLEAIEEVQGDNDLAFVKLEKRFREKLQNQLARLEEQNTGWLVYNSLYIDYMNQTISAATALDVDLPIELPSHGADHHLVNEYKDFTAVVDAFSMRVRIARARRVVTNSVHLTAEEKTKVHHFCEQIRQIIQDSDAEIAKKEGLLNALNRFVAEVDRDRTGLDTFGSMLVGIASYAGQAAEKLKPVVDAVARILGNAKEEEQKRLPPPPKRLPAPPKRLPAPEKKKRVDDDVSF